MNRRRQAGHRADDSAADPTGAEETTRVRESQPLQARTLEGRPLESRPLETLDDPPTTPAYDPRYDDPVITLDPEDAVSWTDSMDDGWGAEPPTRNRLRRPQRLAPIAIDDPPTVTEVTQARRRRSAPPVAAQPVAARPPAAQPPAAQPPVPKARDSSPWVLDEQSMSSTLQPGERRLLPGDLAASQPHDPSQPSQPPSMAVSVDDLETSAAPEPAPELHPGERRLMPPDSVFPEPVLPEPVESAPPPPSARSVRRQSARPKADVAWPVAAAQRAGHPILRSLVAVVVMAVALAAVLWLLL